MGDIGLALAAGDGDDEIARLLRNLTPEAKEALVARVAGVESGAHQIWYCTRGRSCDGDPHPGAEYPHARGHQWPPPSADWLIWALIAGRGGGKTRSGAEYTRQVSHKLSWIGIVGPTNQAVRDVMIEGESGLVAVCERAGEPCVYEPTKKRVTFASGAVAHLFSAEEPKRLRGPQHCFVAGTLVRTEHGEVPIELIRPGDRVWTRAGLRRVIATDSLQDEVITKIGLTGTADHRVWTENRGWVPLGLICPDDTLVVWSGRSATAAAHTAMSAAARSIATARSTSNTTARSRPAGRSTTAIATDSTTIPATFSRSPWPSIASCIAVSPGSTPVGAAVRATSMPAAARAGTAMTAGLPSTTRTSTAPSSSGRASSGPASSAAPRSPLAVASSARSAASTSGGTATVHDIHVEGPHEFFANDVLVHNSFVWADEPAHWDNVELVWDMIMFGLRLPPRPHLMLTTTPLPTAWMKGVVADPRTRVVRFSTYENIQNLAPNFAEKILADYEGTYLGRQEIHGEIIDDRVGALWSSQSFQYVDISTRSFERIVVGVDPAGSAGKRSDETGIVVAGVQDGGYYVLDDFSGKFSPQGWAEQVRRGYDRYAADAVVVERNYGGDMVRQTLIGAGYDGRIVEAHATDGKRVRAEPIAALYEREQAYHARTGRLDKLETEMVSWVPGEGRSPNRVDALVWAMTELRDRAGGQATAVRPHGSVRPARQNADRGRRRTALEAMGLRRRGAGR